MKKKIILDAFEQDIENNIDKLIPVSEKERKKIHSIIEKVKKNTNISLRINNYDLGRIKEKAEKSGLPYQTLITTVLHKYIDEELLEKNEVLKTLKILKTTI